MTKLPITSIEWSDEDNAYIATRESIKTHGDSPREALTEMEIVWPVVLKIAAEHATEGKSRTSCPFPVSPFDTSDNEGDLCGTTEGILKAIDLTQTMVWHGLDRMLAAKALKYALEWQSVFDLMQLWDEAGTDESAERAALHDLQEVIDDIERSQRY